MQKSPSNDSKFGYRLYADKAFMDFLRPMREDRFTRMDAYCYLLDRAVANAEMNHSSSCESHFVITITELSETWHWHRATVRSFLNSLEYRGRITRKPAAKCYIISMKLHDAGIPNGCPYAIVFDDGNVTHSATTESGQLSTSDVASPPGEVHYSFEDVLHMFFTFMASNPNGFDIIAKEQPVNLLKKFNRCVCQNDKLHQTAIDVLTHALKTDTPPSKSYAANFSSESSETDTTDSLLSDSLLELLDQIYLRYICRRCPASELGPQTY